ncbi:MAG: flagellar hook-basal body complex protein [Ignavibacteriota bacterium]
MDSLTITAAGGLRSRMESLDMLANNIANSETGGYKADREFYNIYASLDATGADGGDPSLLPVIEKNYTDFSQGVVRPTSNQLDCAIQGKGFFTVNTPAGVAYTRSGSFQISAAGTLVTADGNTVLDTDGKPITLDPSTPVSIGADGTVSQSGSAAAQITLVDFADSGVLAKQGNTMFRPQRSANQTAGRARERDPAGQARGLQRQQFGRDRPAGECDAAIRNDAEGRQPRERDGRQDNSGSSEGRRVNAALQIKGVTIV